MDAKYDVNKLRERAEDVMRNLTDWAVGVECRELLALLDDLATLQHENESWRLIDEQNHRDLERYEQALKRLAEMDYACDDKDCAASDVANEALDPAKH